jgi:2,3-bisphosphoglycerate-dependent phosphoglycerate mutase
VGETRIVLVRHGESKAQEGRFVGGHAGCTGLSDLGVKQVTALRDRLAATGELRHATALYTSVLPRAVQTAEILAPALGDLPIERDCRFCESHAGEGDGLTWDEFDQRWPHPEEWTPDTRRDPGSETYGEMHERVAARLDAVVERHPGETVVVACHGGVVLHSMFRWLELGRPGSKTRARFDVVNASMTEWRIGEAPSWGSGVELTRYNDHAHLGPELRRQR